MTYPIYNREYRGALCGWIDGDRYTHAIALNTDRELTSKKLHDIFGRFTQEFDRSVLDKRNLVSLLPERRLRAIVFPENLSTNAHLHGVADFSIAMQRFDDGLLCNGRQIKQTSLEELVRCIWLQSNRGAGSIMLRANPDLGWAYYSTKKLSHQFYTTADYFSR